MARLLRPVMKIISVIPAATASSTAYWINGLSMMGSISLCCALVAGKKRLPSPATGNTAFLIFLVIAAPDKKSTSSHGVVGIIAQSRHSFGTGLLGTVAGHAGRAGGRSIFRPGLDQGQQGVLVQNGDAEFLGLGQLAAGFSTGHYIAGFFGNGSTDLAAGGFDPLRGVVARQGRQRAGEDEYLAGQRLGLDLDAGAFRPVDAG